MSWERTEYKKIALCACTKGKVIQYNYREDDDWNRTREGVIGEEICCNACKEKYHIEHYVRRNLCPSWESDGIIDEAYLIPNGMTIKLDIGEKNFSFSVDEEIASKYLLEEIVQAKNDMIRNKFSTRLEQSVSKGIVSIYFKRKKQKRLNLIVSMLQDIEKNYNSYEWNCEKLKDFRNEEKIRIEQNKKTIKDVLDTSIKLEFGRFQNDQT